jgi:hypothetical protein
MTTALGFFDAACAAGDDSALELRAYALAGMERFVEAAETLDAFLLAHPLATLPAATRTRVAAQQPAILARIASLTVETREPGARVSVNHQAVGTTPLHVLRLLPGKYDVEVVLEGQPAVTRTLDLAAGERTETFAPSASAPSVEVVRAGSSPLTPSSSVVPGPPGKPLLSPLVIGTGAATVALLGAGVGGLVWASERNSLYASNDCASAPRVGCSSVLSQAGDARDVEIVGFIGAGVAAIATGVLFYLDHREPHRPVSPIGSIACTVPGAAVSCQVRF